MTPVLYSRGVSMAQHWEQGTVVNSTDKVNIPSTDVHQPLRRYSGRSYSK